MMRKMLRRRKAAAMRNELTKKDIEMMQRELDQRRIELRPKLLEAVKEARAFWRPEREF